MANKTIASNVFWKFFERITAQLVSFIVSLILARILSPNDYGTVAILLVFIEIANAFVAFGLGNSLIQKKDADDLDFSSVLFFNLGLSIVLYFLIFVSAPYIAHFYSNKDLILVIRVFSLRIILASINSVQQAYVSKQMIFKKFFLATFFGTVISGFVGVIFAYKGFGVWALVAQNLINNSVDTCILALTIGWRPKLVFSLERIITLYKFGWKILVEGIANTISGQIRNLIIGKIYTSADLGYYTKAQQFPNLIMVNINTSISSVLFPAMSNIQDDEKNMLFLMRKAIRVSSYLLFPMLFGMAAVANNMIIVLLTEKWIGCVPFVYIFCFSQFMTIGMQPRHQALKAKGRSDVFMYEHMLSRIINFLILIEVYRISIMAIALSGIIGVIILAVIISYTSKKYTGYLYKDQFQDIRDLLIISIIMFFPTFLIGQLLEISPLIELFIQIAVGIFTYCTMSYYFKPEGYVYVLAHMKKIFSKEGNRL